MSEHRIRLAGPWRFRMSGQSGLERMERLPLAGSGVSGAGKTRLIRGFHAPSRLSGASQLRLAFVGRGRFVVHLNGEVLSLEAERRGNLLGGERLSERYCRIPISLLKSFNEVQFEVAVEPSEDWSVEGVWLVISESAGQPTAGGES
ncbi:MAG: hypothetical protein RIT02_3701 [Planctomycetota bacterium]|jgi:hypothetical protein